MCNAVARKHTIKAVIARERAANPAIPEDLLRSRIVQEVVPHNGTCGNCPCFADQVTALLAKAMPPASHPASQGLAHAG